MPEEATVTKEMKNGAISMVFTVLSVMAGFGMAPAIGWVAIPVSAFMLLIVFTSFFVPTWNVKSEDENEAVLLCLIFFFGLYGIWVMIHPAVALIIFVCVLVPAVASDNKELVSQN